MFNITCFLLSYLKSDYKDIPLKMNKLNLPNWLNVDILHDVMYIYGIPKNLTKEEIML